MKLHAVLTVAVCAMLASAALGDVIVYDTFEQPGYGHSTSISGTVGHYSQTVQAVQFQVSESGYFTELYAPVTLGSEDSTNEVTFTLMTDVNSAPGEELESMTLVDQMTLDSTSLVHGIGAGTTFLDASQTYWLAASAPITTPYVTSCMWYWNSVGVEGNKAVLSLDTGPDWYLFSGTTPAFSIAVSPIPEPSALALLALGGLLGIRRRG